MDQTTTATPKEQSQTNSRRWMILSIGASVALYWISLYLYVPTLPVFVQKKVGDLAAVGVILSMYGLWQAIVRLPRTVPTAWPPGEP